jgi:hypothetical protein
MEFVNVDNSNIIGTAKYGYNICDNLYSNSDCIRTDDNRANSFQDSGENSQVITENNERNDDNIINIYRYKFTNEFTEELFKFSKIHQYDHRKDFKEAWEIWTDNNSILVDEEVRRLSNLGYEGDIIDKMFKSARYYFRKKSTEKKEPAKRRIYVGSQKDLLEQMDEHIKNNIDSGDFKPSDGFDEFCKENVNLLKEQVTMLIRSGITDSNEIKAKIKKTYKNRYFLIINK